jgi:hypothetical protein
MMYCYNNFSGKYWTVFGPKLCGLPGNAYYRGPDYRGTTVLVYPLFQSDYLRQEETRLKRENSGRFGSSCEQLLLHFVSAAESRCGAAFMAQYFGQPCPVS